MTIAFLFTPSSFSPFFPMHWASINGLLTKLEFQAQRLPQHPLLPKFHSQMSNFNIPKVAWGTFASHITSKPKLKQTNYSAMAKGYWCMPMQCMETKEKWQGQKHDVHFQWLTCAQFPGGYFAAGVQYPTAIVPIRQKTPFCSLWVALLSLFYQLEWLHSLLWEACISWIRNVARCRDTAELQNYKNTTQYTAQYPTPTYPFFVISIFCYIHCAFCYIHMQLHDRNGTECVLAVTL